MLLRSLRVYEYKTYKKYPDSGTRTNVVCFRSVLLSRVNALGCLRLRQPPFAIPINESRAS